MTVWKDFNVSLTGWTTLDHVLDQHSHLLTVGGHPCKLLTKNLTGEEVGDVDTPLPVTDLDLVYTSTEGGISTQFPGVALWTFGDDTRTFPDTRSIKVIVDDVELEESYDATTMESDSEFFIIHNKNVIDTPDSISIYFNSGFDISGKTVAYYYTTMTANVDMGTLQPKDVTGTYRSLHGFTQYLNPGATFKGKSVPHTLPISFPTAPPFDTTYSPFGSNNQWLGKAWTLGSEVQVRNGDIIYRVSDDRWYEIIDYEPNLFEYNGEWMLLTQTFGVTQLGPNDILRQFTLE